MLRISTMSVLSSSNKLRSWWLVRRAFPLSEFKVGCEIITWQDLRELSIVGFNCTSFPSILRAVKFVALLVPAWRIIETGSLFKISLILSSLSLIVPPLKKPYFYIVFVYFEKFFPYTRHYKVTYYGSSSFRPFYICDFTSNLDRIDKFGCFISLWQISLVCLLFLIFKI